MKICVRCGYRGLTWSDSKRAYARMVEAGVPLRMVQELSPMCGGKCATAAIKEMGLHTHDPQAAFDVYMKKYAR